VSVTVKVMSHEYIELTHGASEVSVGSTTIVRLSGVAAVGSITIADSEHESVKVMSPHEAGETT